MLVWLELEDARGIVFKQFPIDLQPMDLPNVYGLKFLCDTYNLVFTDSFFSVMKGNQRNSHGRM